MRSKMIFQDETDALRPGGSWWFTRLKWLPAGPVISAKINGISLLEMARSLHWRSLINRFDTSSNLMFLSLHIVCRKNVRDFTQIWAAFQHQRIHLLKCNFCWCFSTSTHVKIDAIPIVCDRISDMNTSRNVFPSRLHAVFGTISRLAFSAFHE